jgi:CDP-glycerol glycerophosphotransferase
LKTTHIHQLIIAFLLAIRQTLVALLSRLIGFPLTMIIRRDPDLIVVISRPGNGFADNSKYFFIYATDLAKEGEKVVMLTEDYSTQSLIAAAGGKSTLHPSLRSIWLLLRCGKVVTDMDWFNFGAYPLTCGARLIQLWHGAPLKHIELDLYRKRLAGMPSWLRPFLRIQKTLIGRYPMYDLVVSTSQWFINEVFSKCFKARHFIATGYPRNDILFGWPNSDTVAYRLAWINVDKKAMLSVKDFKARGYNVCLYAPTFRQYMANPFEKEMDLSRLSEFARQQNLLIVIKLHPFMHSQYQIRQYSNIIEYPPLCDVYPLMAMCDLLITDYSSIYFDFLLLDRPILFFSYDLDRYLDYDRDMYFDYQSMTPGAKCHTYEELESEIGHIISNNCRDEYSEKRMRIRSLTHDYIDNQAHHRLIFDHIREL